MAETIAAIATAPGEGGIGVVRVSGEDALAVLRAVWPACPERVAARHAYYGRVFDDSGAAIDEAVLLYMPAPHSYTGEDVVEIQAHGSRAALGQILHELLRAGARLAEPGEFTKRAFLNGRMDLSQAEAVMDIIQARSAVPLRMAAGQLGGRLRDELTALQRQLLDMLAELTARLDFPEEDIAETEEAALCRIVASAAERCARLLATSEAGRRAREGVQVVILGRPNVGKSSLLNALLGQDRAIVTDQPGTTRDTIEESVSLAGWPVVLTDTAGLRDAEDPAEQQGVSRMRAAVQRADMLIAVFDGSEPLCPEDRAMAALSAGKRVLALRNKADLGFCVAETALRELLPEAEILSVSLLDPQGVDAVRDAIRRFCAEGKPRISEHAVITNERQRDALARAQQALQEAEATLARRAPLEITEISIHEAYDALGEILGESAGEEILDAVFSRFCLGK